MDGGTATVVVGTAPRVGVVVVASEVVLLAVVGGAAVVDGMPAATVDPREMAPKVAPDAILPAENDRQATFALFDDPWPTRLPDPGQPLLPAAFTGKPNATSTTRVRRATPKGSMRARDHLCGRQSSVSPAGRRRGRLPCACCLQSVTVVTIL